MPQLRRMLASTYTHDTVKVALVVASKFSPIRGWFVYTFTSHRSYIEDSFCCVRCWEKNQVLYSRPTRKAALNSCWNASYSEKSGVCVVWEYICMGVKKKPFLFISDKVWFIVFLTLFSIHNRLCDLFSAHDYKRPPSECVADFWSIFFCCA